MEIEVKTTKIEKVKIEFPFYTKYGETYFKTVNEVDVIVLHKYNWNISIAKGTFSTVNAFMDGYEVITEKEFLTVLVFLVFQKNNYHTHQCNNLHNL